MATKTALKIKEAFMQYSKKMCTRVTVFWMLYRFAVSVLIFFRPEVSNALVHLTDGVDTVMIANMSVYAGNSICEKGFIAFGKRKKLYSSDDEDDSDDKNDESSNVEENG